MHHPQQPPPPYHLHQQQQQTTQQQQQHQQQQFDQQHLDHGFEPEHQHHQHLQQQHLQLQLEQQHQQQQHQLQQHQQQLIQQHQHQHRQQQQQIHLNQQQQQQHQHHHHHQQQQRIHYQHHDQQLSPSSFQQMDQVVPLHYQQYDQHQHQAELLGIMQPEVHMQPVQQPQPQPVPQLIQTQQPQPQQHQLNDPHNEELNVLAAEASSFEPKFKEASDLQEKVQCQLVFKTRIEFWMRNHTEASDPASWAKMTRDHFGLVQQITANVKSVKNTSTELFNGLQRIFSRVTTIQDAFIHHHLPAWHLEQQFSNNGQPHEHATQSLDMFQSWVEKLLDITWRLRNQLRYLYNTVVQNNIHVIPVSQLNLFGQSLNRSFETLALNSFVVEKQPPQVMKTNTRFTSSVRYLVGARLNLQMINPTVRVAILSENNARQVIKRHREMIANSWTNLESELAIQRQKENGLLPQSPQPMYSELIKRETPEAELSSPSPAASILLQSQQPLSLANLEGQPSHHHHQRQQQSTFFQQQQPPHQFQQTQSPLMAALQQFNSQQHHHVQQQQNNSSSNNHNDPSPPMSSPYHDIHQSPASSIGGGNGSIGNCVNGNANVNQILAPATPASSTSYYSSPATPATPQSQAPQHQQQLLQLQQQHQPQHSLKILNISEFDPSGEILNNANSLENLDGTSEMHAHFRNMQLKKIKRTEKKGTESVMDEKFVLLFHCEFRIADSSDPSRTNSSLSSQDDLAFHIMAFSLPVVVIVHGNQEPHAWATVTWHNAFARYHKDELLYHVPDKVSWQDLGQVLSDKFKTCAGKGLSNQNLNYLATKVGRGRSNSSSSSSIAGASNEQDTKSHLILHNSSNNNNSKLINSSSNNNNNDMITWAQFSKETLPEKSFTFWEWFHSILKLTKEHLRELWNDDRIYGFVGKKGCVDLLLGSSCHESTQVGTFLLRYSETELGGITIAWVSNSSQTSKLGSIQILQRQSPTNSSSNVLMHLQPFVSKDLNTRSLADRIRDLEDLVYLYPDIPKDEAFKAYYTPLNEIAPLPNGYIKPMLIQTLVTNYPKTSAASSMVDPSLTPATPNSAFSQSSPDGGYQDQAFMNEMDTSYPQQIFGSSNNNTN